MLMNNTRIISIDWDHTFRNMEGIDLGILAIVLYAQSLAIPVGITTHRDQENTTLYTLYAWQYKKPDTQAHALAAAISYWDAHLFKLLNINFDFINARHQVNSGEENYYQNVLLPLEKKLSHEIIANNILNDGSIVRKKLQEYAIAEGAVENNEFKEAQILWLSEKFSERDALPIIYHIDDSADVCQQLANRFRHVNTVFYEQSPLLSNETCVKMLKDIGFIDAAQQFLHQPPLQNPLYCLSLCLAVSQMFLPDNAMIEVIRTTLVELEPQLPPDLINLHQFINRLIETMHSRQAGIYLLKNDLSW